MSYDWALKRAMPIFHLYKTNARGSGEYRQEGSTKTIHCRKEVFVGPLPPYIVVEAKNLAPPDPDKLVRIAKRKDRERRRALRKEKKRVRLANSSSKSHRKKIHKGNGVSRV